MVRSLKPINHAQLSRSVFDAISDAIVCGDLAPGAALIDRQLANDLHVSRTPVREALRQLEPTGLVRRQTRGGVTGWLVAEITEEDVRELFELRRLLEPVGLVWLERHWDSATATALAETFDDFPVEFGREHFEAYIERDRQFHKAIVDLSHNSRIIAFYAIMERQIDRIRHFLSIGYEGRMMQIAVEHRALTDALASGDVPKARECLVHHLGRGEEAMIRFGHQRGLLGAPPDGSMGEP